jgi:hypothetical protein
MLQLLKPTLINRFPCRIVLALGAILCVVSGGGQPRRAFALPVNVVIDTSALTTTSALLVFDLFDGDGANNNNVTIQNFVTDGSLGSATTTGDVSGTLPGVVTIRDTLGLGEILQGLTLGNALAFTLDFTTNFAGAPPDNFGVFLLDPTTSFSLIDSDLPGDALLTADMTGPPQGLALVISSGRRRHF